MSQQNVEVVRDHYAATNERDFPRAMSHYAADVELFVHPEAFVERGTFKGRDAVGEWFGNWFTTFEPARIEAEEGKRLHLVPRRHDHDGWHVTGQGGTRPEFAYEAIEEDEPVGFIFV